MKKIKMLITDCDGVLTDGGMYYSEAGDEIKKFNTKDGMAFQILREHGILTAVITGEDRELVKCRAEKMQVDELRMGIKDKLPIFYDICKKYGIAANEAAYIGDDINDLEVIRHAGFSFAPSDCIKAIKDNVDYVCRNKSGDGVVREAVEYLLTEKLCPESKEKDKPLVSIMIPNYMHSQYLDECIQSALNQTYTNLEIVVLDNSSEDKSVEIASKYIEQGVKVCRNAINILNRSYIVLAEMLTEGKYMMLLCADDIIEKDFVETAVDIMECYPNVGYVQGEREFITEKGERMISEPFYNCSFIAPGKNTMPVYMVTTVAHPSQGIFRREMFRKIGGYDMEIDHMNADRALWFYLSAVSDCAYIRKKAARIRVGSQTETFVTIKNFQHIILSHLTIKDFVNFAKEKGYENVYRREQEALQRLSFDILNYVSVMLLEGIFAEAASYLQYSKLINRGITNNDVYRKLEQMCRDRIPDREYLEEISRGSFTHKRGYMPPEGYMELESGIYG